MRMLLCLLVVLMILPGCRSQGPGTGADWEREAAFNSLPTPSELAALRQVAAAPPAKSTLDLLIMLGQEYSSDLLLMAPLDIEYRYPTVSPDGHYLAYLACIPGDEYGTLMVKSFTNPDPDDFYTYMQIDNVKGRVAWHDPTP
ncbi:hypothetical protein JW859_04150 [bacterium]|nr:hypothetical protein [bacterium]